MIALDGGVVSWVDAFMVRREVGAEHGNILGLGFAPRALREAHLLQYEYHLRDIIRERAAKGLRFAATDYFFALPPAGEMPAAAIDSNAFTQVFFPASVPVDLSIIPRDELPALIEESLLLPPIDLTLKDEELASTSVLAVIPVSREDFRAFQTRLNNLTRRLPPAAPDLIAKRSPLESLRLLQLPFAAETVAANIGDDAWRTALSKSPLLWYMRRRNLSYKGDVVGRSVDVFSNELRIEEDLNRAMDTGGHLPHFKRLQSRATAHARGDLVSFLSSPKFAESPALMQAALHDLAQEGDDHLDRAAVHRVAARFADPRLGEGIARLESVSPELKDNPKFIKQLIESGQLPEIDRQARQLGDADLLAFAQEVEAGALGGAKRPAVPAIPKESAAKAPTKKRRTRTRKPLVRAAASAGTAVVEAGEAAGSAGPEPAKSSRKGGAKKAKDNEK
jgi:hypothetical protein